VRDICQSPAGTKGLISDYEVLLITLLFENINKRLADKVPLAPEIANSIIIRVAEIADRTGFYDLREVDKRCVTAAYLFCAADGVSQMAITSDS
jgi:hypothetical protein